MIPEKKRFTMDQNSRLHAIVVVSLVLSVIAIIVAVTASMRGRERHEYMQDVLVAKPILQTPNAAPVHPDAQKLVVLFEVPGRKDAHHDQESVVLVDVTFTVRVSAAADPQTSALQDSDVLKVLVDGEKRDGLMSSIEKGEAYVSFKDSVHLSSKQTRDGAKLSLDLSGVASLQPTSNVWITPLSESVVQFVVRSRERPPRS